MFVFGVHVDAQEIFDKHCLPSIAAFGGADATLITSADKPIARTYNEMLEASLGMEGVEAIVLLRQDVEITDPRFLSKIRDAFARDPRLGIIGPVGGSGVTSLRWWQARARYGRLRTSRGVLAGINEAHAVDCVDGLCMILRPQVAARVRFDDATFTGSSGYDVDYCFRVRDEGFGVAVEPIDVVRHGPAYDDDDAFRSAAAAWQGKRAARLSTALLQRIAERVTATDLKRDPEGAPGSTPAAEPAYDFADPQLLSHLPRDVKRVLDVGCGSGALGAAIKAASGAHVTGIEHMPQAAALAGQRIDEVHELDLTTATSLPWDPEPFDVIILADVLSRLADPEAVLQLLVPHLQEGGLVIATVPNVKHWSVLLPLLLEDRWEYQSAGPLQHANLRFFTMTEAGALFRRVGLGDFESCAAQKLPLEDPAQLEPLLEAIGAYGADVEEAATLINSYQYVIVARRTS